MKVSLSWLKELVDYSLSPAELADKLSLTSIGVKEQTENFLELDLTYNRGDLLSLRGVAREVAAITGSELLFSAQKPSDYPWEGKNLPAAEIAGSISSKAFVYCIAKIENLNVKPSSKEWVKELEDSGMRTVNDLTDITNRIMMEYGQPLHAFDASKSEGIHVETCPLDGWKFVTLDGKERILKEGDILIRNRTSIIGLGGIMGGKNSEVTEATASIYLEAAIFDPIQIRQTAKRLGLQSEASKRFEHELTKTNLLQALAAAIKMYEGLGGKLTAITLTGNLEDEVKTVQLTQQKVNSLISIDIAPEQVENSLKKLGFTLTPKDQGWEVTVPYWRLDINIEEDLIEEVARMYGYEKIEGKPLPDEKAVELDQSFYESIYTLKVALKEAGLTEVETYSFYSTQVIENLKLKLKNLLKIANPISSETEYMRDNLWPNLLEVTAKNLRNGIKDVAIFELGKVYSPQKGDLPKETYHLSIKLCNGTLDPINELYQIFQEALKHLRGEKMQLHLGCGQNEKQYFHPTRFSSLEKNGQMIGEIAEINPRFVNKFGIDQRVAVLEIEINS